jgi:hypothetical protein
MRLASIGVIADRSEPMPRKLKLEKTDLTVILNGNPVTITLFPPTGTRKAWYAYWRGLKSSRSTGCRNLNDAMTAAEAMLCNGGKRASADESVISDEEFEAIQRRHFRKKKDEKAQVRTQKSLKLCLEAISAFREISGVSPISFATPADCERFPEEALEYQANWRKKYPNSKTDEVSSIRPNTVLKWSRTLQAAFERCNKNAGKKCVGRVVPDAKLLSSNPWKILRGLRERSQRSVGLMQLS